MAKRGHGPTTAETQARYGRAWTRYETWRKGRPVNDGTLAQHLREMARDGAGPGTVEVHASAVIREARERGHGDIAGPESRSVQAALRAKREPRELLALSDEDYRRVLASNGRRRGDRRRESTKGAAERAAVDDAILSLLFETGLERRELSALRWQDVDTARGAVAPGGGEATERMLGAPGWNALRKLYARSTARADERVIGLAKMTIDRRVRRMCAAAGLEGTRTAESVRIGGAVERIRAGEPERDVRRSMGRTSGESLRRALRARGEKG